MRRVTSARSLMALSRIVALLLAVGLAVASCADVDNRSSTRPEADPSPTVIDRLPEPELTAWVEVSSSNLEAIRYNEAAEELDVLPLPFIYESTGVETRFTNGLDPDPRSREVFAVHRPETLAPMSATAASTACGAVFESPSSAGAAALRVQACNGWHFWQTDTPRGPVRLSRVREDLLERQRA